MPINPTAYIIPHEILKMRRKKTSEKQRFVIQYEWDGGDNASDLLEVHCVEYESLEKLEKDFKELASSLLKKGEFHMVFENQFFTIIDMHHGQWPTFLPLEKWFEERKAEKENEFARCYKNQI